MTQFVEWLLSLAFCCCFTCKKCTPPQVSNPLFYGREGSQKSTKTGNGILKINNVYCLIIEYYGIIDEWVGWVGEKGGGRVVFITIERGGGGSKMDSQ